jgi:pimeloyl-ACP methyl ester carboxylesterase
MVMNWSGAQPVRIMIEVGEVREAIAVDVYKPDTGNGPAPSIILVTGGAGKDLRSGDDTTRGKSAVGTHDLAAVLASEGYWAFVPSRRGDPAWTYKDWEVLPERFRARMPRALCDGNAGNNGTHTHLRQVEELHALQSWMQASNIAGLDASRIGIFARSAGCGIALRHAASVGKSIRAMFFWGAALRTSQWFLGPKSDEYFNRVLTSRGICVDRQEFCRGLCDAIDWVGAISIPLAFGCADWDGYAPVKSERDPWTGPEEQIQLLRYSLNARDAIVIIVKGAEHTMYLEHPTWTAYSTAIISWFREKLPVITI